MNNRTGRPGQFSPAEISKVLARYRQSGLGVVQFAQERGIPPGRLHYWIYQKGRKWPRNSSRPAVSKSVFQELKVATMLPAMDGWIAEVNLPDGFALRFGQRAAAEWVAAVVQALRRSC